MIKDLSSQFYKRAKKIVENKVNIVRQDIVTEKTKAATYANTTLPAEIILKEEEAISLSERFAQEISKNGIECKAITDIGSLEIERKPCYSYLFPMGPRIVTNRGYIKLKGNSIRNLILFR